ncbi:unnamed protein product [Arabidopsis thaliana]|uniref:(thale cress) hypothetical protein n=1 Tax=Arabidopsis thaliana TaxID=3702 RepID=A0A7G2ED15_ARATH|nr:unnamed protein product [Arabidopsis thaliana]
MVCVAIGTSTLMLSASSSPSLFELPMSKPPPKSDLYDFGEIYQAIGTSRSIDPPDLPPQAPS